MMQQEAARFEGSLLGIGSYSRVVGGTFGGAPVAVKILANDRQAPASAAAAASSSASSKAQSSAPPGSLIRELRCLTALQHPHIVSLLGVQLDRPAARLVFPLAAHGDLARAIEDAGFALPLERVRAFMRQMLSAAAHMHSAQACAPHAPVVHRDLKPTNVLLFGAGAGAGVGACAGVGAATGAGAGAGRFRLTAGRAPLTRALAMTRLPCR